MATDRRAVLGLGLAGATLAAASAQASPAESATAVEGDAAGRYAAAIADIRAYAERHMSVYGLPGLTLSVVAPEGVTAFLRFGYAQVETRTPVNPSHLFQIGSISKSFTALCIFRLMDAGKLSLDDDVARLLPGVPLPDGAGEHCGLVVIGGGQKALDDADYPFLPKVVDLIRGFGTADKAVLGI